ncbi:MAG: SPOR domain-containing protein [Ignavibacteriaceae bacterium]|nr:SPOR domain-containing protein [Ignavibacteriaceae bacterium]
MKTIFFSLAIIFFTSTPFAQDDIDIVPYLKRIEAGEIETVRTNLVSLKVSNPLSINLLFLEGVVTENGQDAVSIYDKIVKEHPDNRYADAALYRIYSYYYALGLYETARTYQNKLQREYPESPYIKLTVQNLTAKNETQAVKQEEKNEPPRERPIRPVARDYKFTIQAGAFSSEANAASLKKEFEEAGYSSELKEKSVGGATFHIVLVGNFVEQSDAQSFLEILAKQYNLEGRIIPLGEN